MAVVVGVVTGRGVAVGRAAVGSAGDSDVGVSSIALDEIRPGSVGSTSDGVCWAAKARDSGSSELV